MSTKALHRVLNYVRQNGPEGMQAMAAEALAEVEAIEKACRLLYHQGVVHNELGEQHETTPQLDAAADHLMKIGEEST